MFTIKPDIVFIGAGKVAYSLIYALNKAGYKISAVASRKISSAKKISSKFKIPYYYGDLKSITNKHNVFFITAPDNKIKKIAEQLALLNIDFTNSLFIHLSGALDVNELKPLSKKKAYTASFHIMQTFPSTAIVNLQGCSAAVETESKLVKDFLFKLSKKLKLKPFHLKSENKIYYHLTGVFTSNFLVGNMYAAEKMFYLSKKQKSGFFSTINPFLYSTLDNIKKAGPAKALSGPVERGDFETVQKHLKVLKKKDNILYMNYLIQSLYLVKTVESKSRKINEGQMKIRKNLIKELNQIKRLTK